MRKAAPCKTCDRRKLGCHGMCEPYQQWKKDNERPQESFKYASQLQSVQTKKYFWKRMIRK